MHTKTQPSKEWTELFNLIPTTLQHTYTIVYDQILGKTVALAKVNPEVPLYVNQGHEIESNFYSKKEMKAFLMGMQTQIKINNNK